MVPGKQPVHSKKYETTSLPAKKMKTRETTKVVCIPISKQQGSATRDVEGTISKGGWESGTYLESRQKAKIPCTSHAFYGTQATRGNWKTFVPRVCFAIHVKTRLRNEGFLLRLPRLRLLLKRPVAASKLNWFHESPS